MSLFLKKFLFSVFCLTVHCRRAAAFASSSPCPPFACVGAATALSPSSQSLHFGVGVLFALCLLAFPSYAPRRLCRLRRLLLVRLLLLLHLFHIRLLLVHLLLLVVPPFSVSVFVGLLCCLVCILHLLLLLLHILHKQHHLSPPPPPNLSFASFLGSLYFGVLPRPHLFLLRVANFLILLILPCPFCCCFRYLGTCLHSRFPTSFSTEEELMQLPSLSISVLLTRALSLLKGGRLSLSLNLLLTCACVALIVCVM